MQKPAKIRYLIAAIFVLFILLLAGCNGSKPQDPAAAAIEAYLQALINKDENKMINLSCADWEANARAEYNSFAAVEVRLEGLDCQTSGQDQAYTLVSCAGSIIASYGAEDLVIELPQRVFQTIEEGGEWRMCGYQ